MLFTFQVEQYINQALCQIQSVTSKEQSRVSRFPLLLTESLSVFITNLPGMKNFQTSTMLAYHKLLSLCTEVFARDTLALANDKKCNKASTVKYHTYCLDALCKHGMQALQDLVYRSDISESFEFLMSYEKVFLLFCF